MAKVQQMYVSINSQATFTFIFTSANALPKTFIYTRHVSSWCLVCVYEKTALWQLDALKILTLRQKA